MKTRFPRILIACPVRNREKIFPEYLDRLLTLKYPRDRVSFYFIVNNSEDRTEEILWEFASRYEMFYEDVRIQRVTFDNLPADNRSANVRMRLYSPLAVMRNMIRDWAITTGVDYIFSVDSDILLEPNHLQQLLSHGKDCVAGLISNCPATNRENLLYYNEARDKFYRKDGNGGAFGQTGLIQVDLTGAVMLISRHAFLSGQWGEGLSGEDEGFARYMRRAGIEMFVDCDCRPEHVMDVNNYVRK